MKYIAIPMGGIGERFSSNGYIKPKPMIMSVGDSIINRVIRSLPDDNDLVILVGYGKELREYNLETYLIKHHPNRKFLFKPLEYQTRGASETLLCLINSFELEDNAALLSIDCDTIQETAAINQFFERKTSSVLYFEEKTDSNIYSFINISDEGNVTSIKEKVRISNKACSGGYGFSSVSLAKRLLETVIAKGLGDKEFYLSSAIAEAIANNIPVIGISANEKICLGTPQELQLCSSTDKLSVDRKTFCFDLDNTLVTFPRIVGDYSTVEPIEKNIVFLREMKNNGHKIIIHSARGMLSCFGDLEKIKQVHYDVIIATLQKFNIPYDEIILGKPIADFYIDDLAINSMSNLQKETGFYIDKIQSRSHNSIVYDGDKVLKTTTNRGEAFWYKNIPEKSKHLFTNHRVIDDFTIMMDRIDGISYSSMLINGSLSNSDIDRLVSSLKFLHQSAKPDIEEEKIYDLYLPKLFSRHSNMPTRIRNNSDDIVDFFVKYFQDYCYRRAAKKCIMHGDPVFTNIFIDTNKTVKMIDMRGMVGNRCTISGDENYDWAKILQSLIGYDSIIKNCSVSKKYSDNLIKYFLSSCGANEKEIMSICSYLLYTLIPLHEDNPRIQDECFSLSKQIVSNLK